MAPVMAFEASGIGVADAWAAFERERSVTLCATSLSTDYRQVSRWLSRCPVRELDRGREVMGWVLSQQPRQSALRVGRYVKTLYRWAASEDVALVPRNPVASYKFPKRPQAADDDVVVIPRDEREALLAAMAVGSRRSQPWGLVVAFLLQTGLRTGEAFAAQWGDLAQGRLLVHQNMTLSHGLKNSTKTARRRWVPLNATAMAVLGQFGGEGAADAFIFPWSRQSFMSYFKARAIEAVATGRLSRRYRPYDLRHTAISAWLEAGVPVAQCAAWAGNSAQVIWRHYAATTSTYEMPEL